MKQGIDATHEVFWADCANAFTDADDDTIEPDTEEIN
jgi:hypothetical protein